MDNDYKPIDESEEFNLEEEAGGEDEEDNSANPDAERCVVEKKFLS